MELVEIRDLTFRYALAKEDSLKKINLKIREGEFCLIFGASGSGKTTLLRHMKRELIPVGKKDGSVFYRGRDINSLDAKKSACEIGLVMQDPDSQIVTDVVWHELAFGLENLGVESGIIRRRVAEMAAFFGIGALFHKKTAELSGGQKQLINLASVLAMQPRLLLLDEPTSQLDPIAARQFIDMVTRLNREFGITVIMTEHRLEDVLPVATHAVLTENGHIIFDGLPRLLPAALASGKDARYIDSLPAAARIFVKAGALQTEKYCPLTVREGKERLRALFETKSAPPRPNNETAECKKEKSEKNIAVECVNIFFKYTKDAPDVLNSLSLKASSGEFLCLLGENGSGKSTLLKLIAGILRPNRGKIKIHGKNIRSYSANELYYGNIAFLPQNPKSVFLHDKLRDEFGESGLETAKRLGLERLLDRHPYDLSGGEQQKAALARILLQNPSILLLDEPTKGLDSQAKAELAKLLSQLRGENICIIASTHDIDFAAQYADRCTLLFDGSIVSAEKTRGFFSGNCFYTTAANRIARDFDSSAVTCEDVIRLCKE